MVLTRFAPSPTGLLHLGHAHAAARAFGFGPCLLRVEDIDHTRSKPEFTDAMLRDLAWLGFDWPEPVRIQSRHVADYDAVIASLTARGLTYEDYRTRSGDENRTLPPAVKLDVARASAGLGELRYEDTGRVATFDPASLPDPVLARRDIGTSYHVAVTHDDHLQGITDVVRGRDLSAETPVHVLLQTLMGWAVPRYHHHSLVMEPDGRKMSKRRGSMTIRSLRDDGLAPRDVLDLAEHHADMTGG